MVRNGYAAAVAASAPGRICLAGESLDWMTGGSSIVASIPLRTTVTLHSTGRPGPITFRAGAPLWASRSVPVVALGAYQHDALDLLQATAHVLSGQCGDRLSGTLLESETELPIAAGVASSAAVTVAAAGALLLLAYGPMPHRAAISAAAYQAESRELGTGAGWMDFLGCTYGGVCEIQPGQPPTVTRLTDAIGTPIVLVDTRQRRSTKRVLASKRDRFDAADQGMRRYANVTPRIVADLHAALRARAVDYPAVGALLTEAHELLRDWVRCSTALIEECVNRCLSAGAYGAKLSGSGHGGCLFALVPWGAIEPIRAALAELPVHVMVFTTGEALGVVFLPSDYWGVHA